MLDVGVLRFLRVSVSGNGSRGLEVWPMFVSSLERACPCKKARVWGSDIVIIEVDSRRVDQKPRSRTRTDGLARLLDNDTKACANASERYRDARYALALPILGTGRTQGRLHACQLLYIVTNCCYGRWGGLPTPGLWGVAVD